MTEPTLRPFKLPMLRKPQHKAAGSSAPATDSSSTSVNSSSTKLQTPARRTPAQFSSRLVNSSNKRLKALPVPVLPQSPAVFVTQHSAAYAAAGQRAASADQAAANVVPNAAASDASLVQLPSLKRRRLAVPMVAAVAPSTTATTVAGAAASPTDDKALPKSPSMRLAHEPLTCLKTTARAVPVVSLPQRVKRRRSLQHEAPAGVEAASAAALTAVSGVAVAHVASSPATAIVTSAEAKPSTVITAVRGSETKSTAAVEASASRIAASRRICSAGGSCVTSSSSICRGAEGYLVMSGVSAAAVISCHNSPEMTQQQDAAVTMPCQQQDAVGLPDQQQDHELTQQQDAAVSLPGQQLDYKVTQQRDAVGLQGQQQDTCKNTAAAEDPTNSRKLIHVAAITPGRLVDKCKGTAAAEGPTNSIKYIQQQNAAAAAAPGQLQDTYNETATAEGFCGCSKVQQQGSSAVMLGQLQKACRITAHEQELCDSAAGGTADAGSMLGARSLASSASSAILPASTAADAAVDAELKTPSAAARQATEQAIPAEAAAAAMGPSALQLSTYAAAVQAVPLMVQNGASQLSATAAAAGSTAAAAAAGSGARLRAVAAGDTLLSAGAAQASGVHSVAGPAAASPGGPTEGLEAAPVGGWSVPAAASQAAATDLQEVPPQTATATATAVGNTTIPTAAEAALPQQRQPAVLCNSVQVAQPSQICQSLEAQSSQHDTRLPPPRDLPTAWDVRFSRELPGLQQLTGRLPQRKVAATMPDTLDQLLPPQQSLAAAQQALWRSMMPRKLVSTAVVSLQQQQHGVSSRAGMTATTAAAAGGKAQLQEEGGSENLKTASFVTLLKAAVVEACRMSNVDQREIWQQQQQQQTAGGGDGSGEQAYAEQLIDIAAYAPSPLQPRKDDLQLYRLAGQQQQQQQQQLPAVRSAAVQHEQLDDSTWHGQHSGHSFGGGCRVELVGNVPPAEAAGHHATTPVSRTAALNTAIGTQEPYSYTNMANPGAASLVHPSGYNDNVCQPPAGSVRDVHEAPLASFAADFDDCDAMLSDLASLME